MRPPRFVAPLIAVSLLLAVLLPRAAQAGRVVYALDPVHTRIGFLVEHSGFSRALGTFSNTSGTLVFDPDDWTTATLDVRVPLNCIALGDAAWKRATLGGRLLDADAHPVARFVSTRVLPGNDDTATVFGNLTLRGMTREVALQVKLNALKRHPLTLRRTAGFSATATLSRRDFGITAWKNVIGDRVELIIEVEAQRRGKARASDGSDNSDPDNSDPDNSDSDSPAVDVPAVDSDDDATPDATGTPPATASDPTPTDDPPHGAQP